MFINKLANTVPVKPSFKGYDFKVSDDGRYLYDFNYSFDSDKYDCYLELYKVDQDENFNYQLGPKLRYRPKDAPSQADLKLNPTDNKIDLKENYGIGDDEAFAYNYKLVEKNNPSNTFYETDSAQALYRDGVAYNLVTANKATKVLIHGPMYLAIPDSFNVGYKYKGFNEEDTGKIVFEQPGNSALRNFANKYNGSIAGMEQKIPELSKTGYKRLLSTPVLSGDNISSHHYWNKNNMQVCPDLGNANNFASMQRALFRNGMNFVSDGVFTSEGLMGVHLQYAMKWINKGTDPQTKDWFMLENSKDGQIGYGVIPENKKNLGHRLVNWPYNYEIVDNKLVKTVNPDYDNTQPKYVQIYDKSQVSDELLANKNELIKSYDKVNTENELEYNTHNDTLIPFYFEFNEQDYEKNLQELIESNKANGTNIDINTPDGTEMLVKNDAFKIIPKFESGTTNWDANTDLVKMNYESPEVRDLTVSAGKYWTRKTRDILVEYAAHALGNVNADNADEKINTLIKTNAIAESDNNTQYSILPEEVAFNSPDGAKKVLENVREYSDKNFKDVLTESLMNLPLDSIEFADNVQAVLSTSFFTNRASREEEIGKTRYELEKEGNPQLKNTEYTQNYNNVNSLFKNEIYNFAVNVLAKVDEKAEEKIYKDGQLTTYGEHVIPLVAEDIAKYAIIKGLSKKDDVAKILSNNEIGYDYEFLNNKVTLDYLDVNGFTPKNEAEQLFKQLSKGVKSLNENDIDFVAKSVSGRLKGTNKNSFALAENMIKRSGLGLDWRLDAAKDVFDMDGIRDRSKNTEEEFDKLVKFWGKFTDGVKEYNPSSYIVAEITDIPELFDASKNWNNAAGDFQNAHFANSGQAIEKFIRETGITSEANYSHLYTDLITVVSRNFENGALSRQTEQERINAFNDRLSAFISNAPEYVKNSYTFVGNHDKPRMLHCLAMDMALFHSDFSSDYDRKRALSVTNGFDARRDFESLPVNIKSYCGDENYFKNMSSKAVAMGYLLNTNISDSRLDQNSKEILYKSIADIVNGNYAYDSDNAVVLSKDDVMDVVSNSLKKSNALSDESYSKVMEETQKLLSDKQFVDSNKLAGSLLNKQNSEAAMMLLSKKMFAHELNSTDKDKYSDTVSALDLETVSNSNTVRAAFSNVLYNLGDSVEELKDDESKKKVYSAIYSAVSDMLLANSGKTEEQSSLDSVAKLYKKNGFGARPIDTALNMVFKHAEKKYDLKVNNEDSVKNEILNSIMNPALAKGKMLMNYLVALPGNPTMFAGDELAMTGYDEKCKNVYLQNRNRLDWTSLENNSQKQKFNKEMNEIMNLRANRHLRALNNGTPFRLNPQHTTENLPIPSLLMRAPDGAMTVSLFNANGVCPENVGSYKPKEVWIDRIYIGPDNTGVTMPANIEFRNANKNDSAEYVTKIENNHYYIVRKDGQHINMNDVTAPNGVMLLYHDPEGNNSSDESKNVSFRRNINKVYNIEKNAYEKTESAKLGENFSV
ncbi:hypothetical protein IJI31_05440 [bacterium]|nr:hypothetical protein [bacterium]